MAFTVTATQTAATSNGMQGYLAVLTGASPSQPGATFTSQSVINTSFTPAATGSIVYGSYLGNNVTYTAEPSNSPYLVTSLHTLRYIQLKTTVALTSGTPVTLGSTASGGVCDGFAVCEIVPAGTLAEDASSPGALAWVNATTLTSPSFTPPPGSILVLALATNGNVGTTTVTVSDTSGLGLVWSERAVAHGSSKGYAAVWTGQAPVAPAAPQPIPPGFRSPASVFFTYRRPSPAPTRLAAPFTGAAAASGVFRGVHTIDGGIVFRAELPGPVVKPLSLASPSAADPMIGAVAVSGTFASAKAGRDPFTGRVAVSGVMAGAKTSDSSFAGPAADSGVAVGVNPEAGGLDAPIAVSGTAAGAKVSESAFAGAAAAAMTVFGTPPVTGSFAAAAAASGVVVASLPAPLFRTGTPFFGWVAGVPETSS